MLWGNSIYVYVHNEFAKVENAFIEHLFVQNVQCIETDAILAQCLPPYYMQKNITPSFYYSYIEV